MSTERLVVIATDGSEASLHAVRAAWRMFGNGARYDLVHVAPERPDPNADTSGFAGPLMDDEEADEIHRETIVEADGILASTAREIGPVPVTQTLLFGDPIFQLCDRAEDVGADVVVIASTGASGLLNALLGSVSKGVIAHCQRPVLVVPNAPRAAGPERS